MLYLDGQPTPLGGRAVELLMALAQRHGRLVTKAELLELVWPGLVVEENNLQVQISTLRKTLGAAAIATVPGRGYRFVLPLVDGAGVAHPLASVPSVQGVVRPAQPVSPPVFSPPVLRAPLPASRTSRAAALSPDALCGLPVQTQPLWGRARELEALGACSSNGLVTLVGPAGMGKTALALAAAHRWQDTASHGGQACWVDLAALGTPTCVLTAVTLAVAQAVGVDVGGEPAAAVATEGLLALTTALRPLNLLLVLDNAEHVLADVATFAQQVVAVAPGVRLLVTSQTPLRVEGERVFRLGPLAIPPRGASVEEAMAHGAVALFVDRVRAIDRRYTLQAEQVDDVSELCRRLDGLALAIQLAAARVPLLGLRGVLQRLDERFRLLAGQSVGAPQRHQTLMAALEWSHALLSPPEQALFRRVAVFAGSFPLSLVTCLGEGGQAGTGTDASSCDAAPSLDEWQVLETLGALVDRSLVVVEGGELPRYRLLDSMREHAILKLQASGEWPAVQARHAHAVADLLDQAYESHWTLSDDAWLGQHGGDLDNVRVALDWALAHDLPLAVRLQGAAVPLFLLMGLGAEARERGRRMLSTAEAMVEEASPQAAAVRTDSVARFWLGHARLHWSVDNALMLHCGQRAAQLSQDMGDARGHYLALHAMLVSGMLEGEAALAMLRDMGALERPHWPARVLVRRGLAEVMVLRDLAHMAEARRACQTLLVRAKSAGLDGVLSTALRDLAAISLALGDTDAALRISQELLARGRHRHNSFVLHALATVACVAFVRADLTLARTTLADFLVASRSRAWEGLGLYGGLLALLAATEGRHEAAARLLGYTAEAHRCLHPRDVLSVYAWSRAHAAVQDALPVALRQHLMAQGAALDAESVQAWALGAEVA